MLFQLATSYLMALNSLLTIQSYGESKGL
jgi:hypothetical protein